MGKRESAIVTTSGLLGRFTEVVTLEKDNAANLIAVRGDPRADASLLERATNVMGTTGPVERSGP